MAPSSLGHERRKERRYEVALQGELQFDGNTVPVEIADLSASGALLMLPSPPPVGSVVDLLIPDFGAIAMEVVHAGETFCGLALANPAEDRDQLFDWLRGEATGSARAASRP
jgi:hypothetical protein